MPYINFFSIKKQGAVPATIGIIDGKIKVGLDLNELSKLADVTKSNPVKTSRRDFPYVIAQKLNGGTTVSGTLVIASKVGIPIFATGGKQPLFYKEMFSFL